VNERQGVVVTTPLVDVHRGRARRLFTVETMAISVLEVHPGGNREWRLDGGGVIGRANGCDIHLDDPFVSRRHARVITSEIGTAIQDLGSSNGIFVNGRLSPGITPLHPGDVVQLGGTIWVVRLSDP
jgi:predicted component of type VI protein secretion system